MHDVKALISAGEALLKAVNDMASAVICPLPQGLSLLPITDELTAELKAQTVCGISLPDMPLIAVFPELHALALQISEMAPIAYISTEYFGGDGGQDAIAWSSRNSVFVPASNGYNDEWPNSSISQALRAIGVVASAGKDEFDTIGLGNHRETHRWAECELAAAPRRP